MYSWNGALQYHGVVGWVGASEREERMRDEERG